MPDLLDAGLPAPARGAFSGRTGGASTGAWAQANLALHVQDDEAAVRSNRAALAAALGVPAAALVFAGQVHGDRVAVVDGPTGTGEPVPGVDALVTTTPGVVLVTMAADCLPVLLADPAGVVAAVHAGRQGLVSGVLQAAVREMVRRGARPGAISAVLGPAVCGRCYELPAALAAQVDRAVPGSRTQTPRGTASVDLAAGAQRLLEPLGVAVTRVGGCTVEQPDRFYSYRRDGVTGRHAGLVWLPA